MFSGRWRVISSQTDGENRCGAPEGKDARSDQAEFCSRGVEWCTTTFGFCFVHWCHAGTVLETPPTWPPRRQISYISCKLKIPLYRSVVDKPHLSWQHVCCTPHLDIVSCSGFDLTTDNKQNQMSAELSSDQTSCSNWYHPGRSSCPGTGCNWNWVKQNQTLVLSCTVCLITKWMGFIINPAF